VEHSTHFNKRTQKHQSPTKPRLLTTQIQRQRSQRGVVLQSVTQSLRSFCADLILYRHTRVERSKYEFSKTVPMGDAASRLSQQSQQAHSLHGAIDRASLQSTLNSPTSGALHTLRQKKPETAITNETKATHLANSATTKSTWCCPSERHPVPSLLLRRSHSLQTHPSGEIQIRIQQNSSNG
jgi:hypothetical protein